MKQASECACATCHCPVDSATGVRVRGTWYCGKTCAYECTPTTCVCVHEQCAQKSPPAGGMKMNVQS